MAENPGARVAHKALAKAATDLIHGESATTEAIRASEILFGGELDGIAEGTFNEILGEVPTKEIEKAKLDGAGIAAGWSCWSTAGLCPSKGQARKDIEGGGVNINNVREASCHAGRDFKRFAFRQARPAPQRQKELRRCDGKVTILLTSAATGPVAFTSGRPFSSQTGWARRRGRDRGSARKFPTAIRIAARSRPVPAPRSI